MRCDVADEQRVSGPAAQTGPVTGPTRLAEWLMVDVRVAREVVQGTRLFEVCQSLGERGACGVIGSTLVVDLLEAGADDRALLLDAASWPAAR